MTMNYSEYKMNLTEKTKGFFAGFFIAFFVIWLFYRSAVASFAFGIVGGVLGVKQYQRKLIEQRKNKVLDQFKAFLESLATSYSAGRNTLNAYKDAERDMVRAYGEKAMIVQEIRKILQDNNNNIRIEASLADFAKRTGLEDIQNFADVYEACDRAGGDIGKVIRDTRFLINDKIEMERNIQAGINSSKANLNMIVILGAVILLVTGLDSSMSIASNSQSLFGIKTVVLVELALSYRYGWKLTNIKL